MGHKLNLNNPQSFSEKLQWLKLYDRRPEYTRMVDKYAVKEYVAKIIGEEYIIPTIGVWDKPEDIEWDKLPNQFVLKTTHGGSNSGVVICKNKESFNKEAAIKKLNNSLKQDIYTLLREWPYKDVNKRIIAEQFVQNSTLDNDLPDYKFFCFNGCVNALFIATDRQKQNVDVKFDYFDKDFNHLPLRQVHENAQVIPPKPTSFEEMKHLAKRLSLGIPELRVDFYEVDGHPKFGELTFFHFSGLEHFNPEEWDTIFGEWITLPNQKNCSKKGA